MRLIHGLPEKLRASLWTSNLDGEPRRSAENYAYTTDEESKINRGAKSDNVHEGCEYKNPPITIATMPEANTPS
jgi:hypothetical protein